jgi:hypothetical protein
MGESGFLRPGLGRSDRMNRMSAVVVVLGLAGAALGQSNVDPAHKFAWSENAGWSNWYDAGSPAGSQGVRVESTYVRGYIWFENGGWVNTGNGPATPPNYSNASGADAGVNRAANGDLTGFAWGENVGWLNFDTSVLGPAQRARFDAGAGRFRGWVWGENIGWINLDDPTAFIGVVGACYANCDGSTTPPVANVADFTCFLQKFAANDPYANCDGSTVPPTINVADFTCFLQKFAAGCP